MARTRKTDRTPNWERLVKMIEHSEMFEQQNDQSTWPMGVGASRWEVACFMSARVGGALIKADGDWIAFQNEMAKIMSTPRYRRLIRRSIQ